MRGLRLLVLAGAVLAAPLTHAIVFEPRDFKTPQHEQRYKHLTRVLRCLVCQNENIADSEADLAKDLRNQVFTMIAAGKSDKAIIKFMTDRYGDFVLFDPPVKASTLALWGGPAILGVAALVFLLIQLRARRARGVTTVALSDEDQARADALLGTGNGADKP